MNLEQAITKRIYNLCEAKNITPNKLANMAGISSSTLKSIFYSKSKNTGLRTILELCQALDITVFDFFDDPIFMDKELEVHIKNKLSYSVILIYYTAIF